jgi:transcriptional repressor NrdR
MDVLRDMDEVAYVRFASVYRAFEGVDQFIDTIRPLREGK